MNIQLTYDDLILFAGAFLSLLLTIAFFLRSRRNLANFWLVGFLGASFVVISVKFLVHTGFMHQDAPLAKINYPIGLLRPVFMYLYVYYLLNSFKRMKWIDGLNFLPSFLLFIYEAMYFFSDWFIVFQYVYSFLYLVLTFIQRYKFVAGNITLSTKQLKVIKWIDFLIIAGGVFLLSSFVLRLFDLQAIYNYYHHVLFTLLLIIVSIKLLSLPDIVNYDLANRVKYKTSALSAQQKAGYLEKVNQLMAKDKLYRKDSLKLKDISDKLSLTENQLSQILNEQNSNFRDYINAYRVNEAIDLLKNNTSFSIEGIAYSVGFNSRATFYNAFKKHTGQTPSAFKKKYR